MYWESLRFKSLAITLLVFPNLWQARISIVSNTTPSFSKINKTCSSSRSFVMLLGIPTISMHSRREYSFHPMHVSLHFYYFLINIFVIGWEGQRGFFCNWYFALENFIFLFKLVKFRVNNTKFSSKLLVIVYEFCLLIKGTLMQIWKSPYNDRV